MIHIDVFLQNKLWRYQVLANQRDAVVFNSHKGSPKLIWPFFHSSICSLLLTGAQSEGSEANIDSSACRFND